MALVVFLRGINVGGHRTFRPTVLAGRLRPFGVVNIGAAGAFVIRRPVRPGHLRQELARRLPFDAEITICQGREILRLTSRDPFRGTPSRSDIVRFVSVLSRRPARRRRCPCSFLPEAAGCRESSRGATGSSSACTAAA